MRLRAACAIAGLLTHGCAAARERCHPAVVPGQYTIAIKPVRSSFVPPRFDLARDGSFFGDPSVSYGAATRCTGTLTEGEARALAEAISAADFVCGGASLYRECPADAGAWEVLLVLYNPDGTRECHGARFGGCDGSSPEEAVWTPILAALHRVEATCEPYDYHYETDPSWMCGTAATCPLPTCE